MSWDKRTVVMSEVDWYLRELKKTGGAFVLEQLGTVQDCSLHAKENLPIRKLTFENRVILEVMIRDPDCDGDDVIIHREFRKGEEPKDWPLEYTTPEPA